MKIILDTNVIIDATQDNFSYTWKIVNLVLKGKVEAFGVDKIIKEYRLIIKKNIKNEKDKISLENFIARVRVVNTHKKINLIEDDPEDNKFLECADEARVDYIISSDQHLLNLEKFQNTEILSPKDFWLRYKNEKPSADDEWKEVFKNILS